MISHQITSTIIAISLAGSIIWLVRQNRLHARIAVWWILLAVVIALTGTVPGILDLIAVTLGIHYSPILAVMIGMVVVLLKLLKSDIERTKEQQHIRILAQKIALLESRLQTGNEEKSESANE